MKRLYWVKRSLYWAEDGFGYTDSASSGLTPSVYEMLVPDHVASDGTIIEPHTEIIGVLDP